MDSGHHHLWSRMLSQMLDLRSSQILEDPKGKATHAAGISGNAKEKAGK
jgi:hypothetical protein